MTKVGENVISSSKKTFTFYIDKTKIAKSNTTDLRMQPEYSSMNFIKDDSKWSQNGLIFGSNKHFSV